MLRPLIYFIILYEKKLFYYICKKVIWNSGLLQQVDLVVSARNQDKQTSYAPSAAVIQTLFWMR